LREAGVERADAFIATTNSDEINLIASMLAKGLGARQSLTFLGKAYYVEVLTDPRTMEILGTRIDRVFWPQRALAKEVLEVVLLPKALDTELIAGGRLRLIEYMVDSDSNYAHRLLTDLEWPRGVALLGVLRSSSPRAIPTFATWFWNRATTWSSLPPAAVFRCCTPCLPAATGCGGSSSLAAAPLAS